MTDVLVFNTVNGGEVEVIDGFMTTTDGFETAVYFSLFGGSSWFANSSIDDENEKINTEFEEIVRTTPPSSKGLLTIEDAANRELAWIVSIGAATSINVEVSLPENGLLVIEITIIQISGKESKFLLNWRFPIVIT